MTNFFLKMGYPRPLFCLFLVKHQCNFYNIIFIQYPVLGLNPEPLDQGSYPIDKYIFAAIALNTEWLPFIDCKTWRICINWVSQFKWFCFRNIARFANKAERSFFATPAQGHTISVALTPNSMRPLKASGHVLTARSTVPRTRKSMRRMSTWNSAGSAKREANFSAATLAQARTTWHAANPRSKTCQKDPGLAPDVPLKLFQVTISSVIKTVRLDVGDLRCFDCYFH